MKKLLKKLTKRTIIIILALITIGVPEAKASWLASLSASDQPRRDGKRERSGLDENWLYRKAIIITVVFDRMECA